MPKQKEEKIELISKFLDSEKVDIEGLKKIDDVIKLPTNAFNFFAESEVEIIQNLFDIKKVGEFAILHPEDPFQNMEDKRAEINKLDDEFIEKLKKAVTLSLIIRRMKRESLDLTKKEQKIIVVGLNNAGKTAILSKFGGKLGIEGLKNLRPTKGIDRQEIDSKRFQMTIWDFGGQKAYRDKYLRKPEKYFINLDLIIYVIDVQDPTRYDESIEYFEKIVNIVKRLEESPYSLVFIHKFDPDLRDNSEIYLNVELLKDLIKSIFRGKELDYDIYLSSIYSMVTDEPEFSRYVKDIMAEVEPDLRVEDTKIKGLGVIVENTLNSVIKLSETMMKQFNALESRVKAIEDTLSPSQQSNISYSQPSSKKTESPQSSYPKPAYSSAPPPPPSPPSSSQSSNQTQKPQSVRSAIVSELKELFAKRQQLTG